MEHSAQVLQDLREVLAAVPELELLTQSADLERYSRDAYAYSPVLETCFQDCRAEW